MSTKVDNMKPGQIGLHQLTNDGKIIQIGLTKDQHTMLETFLGIISKETPLVQMGEDYELILKKDAENKEQ